MINNTVKKIVITENYFYTLALGVFLYLLLLKSILPIPFLSRSSIFLDFVNENIYIWPYIETVDKFFYLSFLFILTVLLWVLFIMRSRYEVVFIFKKNWYIYTGFILFFYINVIKKDNRPVADGFNFSVLEVSASILFTLTVYFIYRYKNNLFIKVFNSKFTIYFIVLIIFSYSLSFLQFPGALKDTYHSSFVMNELLSVESRVFPLYNYASQYTNILPYVFYVISIIFEITDFYFFGVTFLVLLQFLILFLMIFLISELWGRGKIYLVFVFLFLLPFTKVEIGDGMNLNGYFQVFPIRLLGPILLISAMFINLKIKKKFFLKTLLFSLTIVFTLFNNFEWGIPSVIVTLTIFYLISNYNKDFKKMFRLNLIILPIFLGFFIYIFFQTNHEINWNLSSQFIQIFGGSGFYAFPLPIFGFYWLYFTTTLLMILFSFIKLLSYLKHDKYDDCEFRHLVLNFQISVFSIVFLSYYINRSLDPVLVDIFLFWFFNLIYFFIFMIKYEKSKFLNSGFSIIFIFIFALGITKFDNKFTIYQELSRLENAQLVPKNQILNDREIYIKKIVKEIVKENQVKVGYISQFSEFDSIKMNLNNAFMYNSIASIFTKEQLYIFCDFHKNKSEFYFILIDNLKSFPNNLNNELPCKNWTDKTTEELKNQNLTLYYINKS